MFPRTNTKCKFYTMCTVALNITKRVPDSEKLGDMCSLLDVNKIIMSRRLRLVGHICQMSKK
jgi:hypothetical protein